MIAPFLIAAAFAALAYLPFQDQETSPVWTAWLKPLCALILVVPFLIAGIWIVAFGLVLSALGDFALTRKFALGFILGLTFFLLAHLAFIAQILTYGIGIGLIEIISLAVYLSISIAAWIFLRRGIEKHLKIPVAAYMCVLVTMAALAVQPHPLLALGALLFIISDASLAWGRFRTPFPENGPFIWVTYAAALSLMSAAFYDVWYFESWPINEPRFEFSRDDFKLHHIDIGVSLCLYVEC